jgi:hypothetical protein
MQRLQEAPDVADADKASVAALVEHLLVKGVSK